MACERYESRLIDEALAPGGDVELTAHLRDCQECRAELDLQRELQRRIAGSVAAMVADEPSPALLTRVRQRADAIDAIVAEDSARRAGWMQWAITGGAVSALAAVAILFSGRALLRQSPPGPQPGQTAAGTPPTQIDTQTHSTPGPAVPAIATTTARAKAPGGNAVLRMKPAHQRAPHPAPSAQLSASRAAPPAATPPLNGAPGFNVIIPPGQREAVLRLVAAMQAGRVNVAGLVNPTEQQQVAPLEIAPLKITPLDEKKASGQSESNHQ